MAAAKRILLVDTPTSARQALADQLAGLGYRVDLPESGAAALALAGDALLLAAGPAADMGQSTLCRAWCEAGGRAPVALAANEGDERVLAEMGAMVLVRPVRLADLGRAIEAAARPGTPMPLKLGAARFHPASREYESAKGETARLTEKEAEILVYLHRAGGRAVPRDELLARLWGYADPVITHTLETHIYRLRRKLARDRSSAPEVVSEAGGYRLVIAR